MWELITQLTTDLNFNFGALLSADEFFGMKFYDDDFLKLVLRLGLNLFFAGIIARGLYYPNAKRKDYLFSFLLTNLVIFFIIFTMKKYEIGTGIGLGLFAIFGIIRFRTSTMPVKEMTYLFIIIGVAVINSLSSSKFSWTELLFTNMTLIAITYIIENKWLLRHEARKVITYEKIENIKTKNHHLLKVDLEDRTGIKISRIEIGRINFLNDTAKVIIFFYLEDQEGGIYQDEGILDIRND